LRSKRYQGWGWRGRKELEIGGGQMRTREGETVGKVEDSIINCGWLWDLVKEWSHRTCRVLGVRRKGGTFADKIQGKGFERKKGRLPHGTGAKISFHLLKL